MPPGLAEDGKQLQTYLDFSCELLHREVDKLINKFSFILTKKNKRVVSGKAKSKLSSYPSRVLPVVIKLCVSRLGIWITIVHIVAGIRVLRKDRLFTDIFMNLKSM